jgi:UPF0755 protein
MKRSILITAAVASALFMAAVGSGALALHRYMHSPIEQDNPKTAGVHIAPGDNFDAIVNKLQRAGLVKAPLKFEIIARWKGFERSLQAGEYRLSQALTPLELLGELKEGAVVLYSVTIPEGFTIRQVAGRMEKAGLAGARDFLAAATDPELTDSLHIPADTVEGYLFPDTYAFAKSAPPERIIRTMVRQLRRNFPDRWKERARELNFSVHEIITLASIIEKETGAPAERPVIASVFHNRLERNMRLETDPTVIYGLEDFDGNLTREDLRKLTPYNTYRIRGLPPGPIANPGVASLRAALYPADTDYLYFVAKPDRTHHFSETLRAHNKAVRKYQLSPGRP